MKICTDHWQLCRTAVDEGGLAPLVSSDGREMMRRVSASVENPEEPANFDPLFSLSNHFMCEALQSGGLYLMGAPPDGSNDGQYCPICEFSKHSKDFDAKEQVGNIVGQMATWARDKGLITKLQ